MADEPIANADFSMDRLRPDIRTIAIGDIENNSMVQGSYNMDHFCKGLVQVLIGDLMGATKLTVVDRQRLAVLQQEIGLGQNPGQMDRNTRAKFGQLSGAQSFLFGQCMQTDRNHVRIDLRWVNTSTGEILLARSAEGSLSSADDLFRLERRVLVDLLAPQIQSMIDGTQSPADLQQQLQKHLDKKKNSLPKTTSYPDAVTASGSAIAKEEAGNYAEAAAEWSKLSGMAPADDNAKTRAMTLAAYQQLKKQGN